MAELPRNALFYILTLTLHIWLGHIECTFLKPKDICILEIKMTKWVGVI